jgi:hypothetical protein
MRGEEQHHHRLRGQDRPLTAGGGVVEGVFAPNKVR